jgi:hypothetical protein
MRKLLTLLVFAPLLFAAGCIPTTMGGVVDTIQTARGLNEARGVYSSFMEARKTEIPLAGTYRLTYSFPGEEPVSVYVRTLRNANMPIAVDRNSASPGSLLYSGSRVTFDGYMVNAIGAASADQVPESLNAAYEEGATPPDVGGFLIVTEPLGKDQMGRDQYVGTFMLAVRDGATGEAGRLRHLMTRTQAEFEAYEQRKQEEARAEARRNRFRVRRAQPQREEEWNLFAGIKSVIPKAPDGSVSGSIIYGIEGEERMRVVYERVSLDAYHIDPEHLDRPGLGAMFRGYRDAVRTGSD